MPRKKIKDYTKPGSHTIQDFKVGDDVLYVVTYAGDNLDHKDNQKGTVKSIEKSIIFVDYGTGTILPSGTKRLINLSRKVNL